MPETDADTCRFAMIDAGQRRGGRSPDPHHYPFSTESEDPAMSKKSALIAMLPLALCASAATAQQYPLLDKVAAKVIAKYQGEAPIASKLFSCGLIP